MAELFGKYTCTYCQENINGLRVQCCVCEDFDICLQCFASGAEIGPHKSDHSYRFKDSCAVILFGGRGSWTCKEEVQLLDAMELYGFGNWDLISKSIGTKTAEEVKDEYIARYLEGNIGKHTWGKVKNTRTVRCDLQPDTGPLAPDATSRLPPLDILPEEAEQLGYMLHRGDFEREYDAEAEQLVSSLSVSPSKDTEIEIALKLVQVNKYIRHLRERARRKRVVRDYQLVAKFFANHRKDSVKKVLTKEQKDFQEKMRVFSQFHTAAEHERLLESLERERELRMRINELLNYRSLGLQTQEDILHYEQHVAFQKQQEQRKNKTGSSGYGQLPLEFQTKNGENASVLNFTDQKCILQENGGSSSSWQDDNHNIPRTLLKLPGSQFLSINEFQLCANLNLLPLQYLTLKTLIIQGHLYNDKSIQEAMSYKSSKTGIKDVVVQYLAASGWLPGIVL